MTVRSTQEVELSSQRSGHTSWKTEHAVMSSTPFVQMIEGLVVPPGRTGLSFYVTALFTSIPVTEKD